jgi:hypothetical protein
MKLSEHQKAKMDEYGIPGYMQGGLVRYYENGIPPGSFLTAVLKNDLMEAFNAADSNNQKAMRSYVMWLYNAAPMGSFGSPEAVTRWYKQKQQEGQEGLRDLINDVVFDDEETV